MSHDDSKTSHVTSSVTRLLVVDDHPIVRLGLVELLSEQPDLQVVAEAANANETMEVLENESIDLLVLDLSLEGMDGLELIKNLKALHGDLPILVVSTHDEKFYAQRALHAGALGYLSKESATDYIVDAVRRVRSGKIYVSEEMSDRMLHNMVDGRHEATDSPIDRLSDRELEVFRGIGRGLSTRQIAEELSLSVKTIETYRENIKTKLDFADGHEMVRYAVQWGLEDT
jgi:DNA-binding NarL/FixJ family response regulator